MFSEKSDGRRKEEIREKVGERERKEGTPETKERLTVGVLFTLRLLKETTTLSWFLT